MFMIHFRPGKAWIKGKSIMEQPLETHGDYMQALYEAKKLVMGGPFMDDEGGVAIIDVPDKEEAERLVKLCPSVVDGIFVAEVHPLMLVFDQSTGLSLRELQ